MSINPFEGFGIGLRPVHYEAFLDTPQPVDFIEVISENFMVDGGRPLHTLDRVRADYRIALHGVSLNIGAARGVDTRYLKRLRALTDRVEPMWLSDHLCWTAVDDFQSHDLLPLPYTDEALAIVCENIHRAQEVLGREILLENPSTYVRLAGATMSEPAFLKAMCERTGCYLLLDINNVYVSATNHDLDPLAWLDGVPMDRVRQVHLAGHSQGDDMLIDTHDAPVSDAVWSLYDRASRQLGPIATMIERDDHIPPLAELLAELALARRYATPTRSRAA